jgi:hypothetical protein
LKPEKGRNDSRTIEAKRKLWERSERHFIFRKGREEYLIVRRLPDNVRLSF